MRRRNAEDGADEGGGGGSVPPSSGAAPRYKGLGGTIDRRRSQPRSRRRKRRRADGGGSGGSGSSAFKVETLGAVAVFIVTLLTIGIFYGGSNSNRNGIADTSSSLVGSSSSSRLRGRSSAKRPRQRYQTNATAAASISLTTIFNTDTDSSNNNNNNNNAHGFRINTPNAPPCDSIAPSSISYTLVTQMSAERSWMLGKHCQRWGYNNPISVAVFTNRTLQNITTDIISNGCTSKQLSLQILDSNQYDDDDYPVNKLRNMALSAVKTTHIMYVDVDFWPSTTLRPVLESSYIREEFASDAHLAIVVPAFQLYAHRLCGQHENCKEKEQTNDVPSTMKELRPLLDTEDVGIFDLEANWNGHGSTSYKTFLLQNEGELFDLPCVNSNRYEPYLSLRYCRDLPPFQEAFTGYGKNKMTWAMQLRRSGYDFAQIGGAFVCHYPHFRSKAKLSWDYIPDLNMSDVLAVSVESRTAGKQDRFNVIEKKDMIRGVDWTQTKRGKGDLLYLDYRKWLYDTIPDNSRLKMCDETYTDDNKLWINTE